VYDVPKPDGKLVNTGKKSKRLGSGTFIVVIARVLLVTEQGLGLPEIFMCVTAV